MAFACDHHVLPKRIKIPGNLATCLDRPRASNDSTFDSSFDFKLLGERKNISLHGASDTDAPRQGDQVAIDGSVDVHRISKHDQCVVDRFSWRDRYRLIGPPYIESVAG